MVEGAGLGDSARAALIARGLAEMSRLAVALGGDADTDSQEAEIFAISPTLMFVKVGYALAALGALFLAAFTSVFLSSWISVWLSVFIGLLLFLIPAYYHFMRKMVSYKLTESKLEIDEGFISRTTRSVPIRRIQDVTVSSTVLRQPDHRQRQRRRRQGRAEKHQHSEILRRRPA
jgi:hypothetical protein